MRRRLPIVLAVAIGLVVTGVGQPATATPKKFGPAKSTPVEDPYYPGKGSTTIDALHYGLELDWKDRKRRLVGKATIQFRVPQATSSVHLDLGGPLVLRSVRLDGRLVAARHPHNDLNIDTGLLEEDSRHVLVVRYAGEPRLVRAPTERSDIFRVGWHTRSGGQVWTDQEPFGAFTWYPVNDHPSDKAYYDITAETRKEWRAVSNGALKKNQVKDGRRTMRWHLGSPAASYLITFSIGPYRKHTQTGPHGLPLRYWVRPTDSHVLSLLQRTPNLLEWLEARLGPYPFKRAGVVVLPDGSAMETQTMVQISAYTLGFGRGSLAILLHELAHQWYGDEVTPRDWTDMWLNETFAMYLQIRWEATHGVQSMASWREYLEETDQRWRDEAGPPGAYDKDKFGATNVYYCGALMLDRIRGEIGKDAFDRLIRDWPADHRFENVDRTQWIEWLNTVAGEDMTAFVEEWLLSPVSPA